MILDGLFELIEIVFGYFKPKGDKMDTVVKIWQEAPEGEYGAWQYKMGNIQGGEPTLEKAIKQAMYLSPNVEVCYLRQEGVTEAPFRSPRTEPSVPPARQIVPPFEH